MGAPTKGSVAGQAIKTDPLTKEYAENFDRIFAKREAQKGGRWVWDEEQKRLVPASEYRERMALHASIVTDRFYENTQATDGTDIGSRRKHREYMRRNNLTTVDDYTGHFAAAEKEREAIRKGENDRKGRREDIARVMYQLHKP